MTLSMYQASIPTLNRMLQNLISILDKAEHYAVSKKIDPAVLVSARLAPDMFALSRQIQIATDTAKGCAARLAGVEVPVFQDTETTLTELKARINKTIEFISSVPREQIEASEERPIHLKLGAHEVKFKGLDYLFYFVLPNFYFHVTTAYDILRHNGVDIGKKDYLGG